MIRQLAWARRRHTVLAAALTAAALITSACSSTVVDRSPQVRKEPAPPGHEVTAQPVTAPAFSTPTEGTISPGVRLTLPFSGSSKPGLCTAGFLVSLPDGRTGVLSAGHCQYPGDAALDASGKHIGTYLYSIDQGKKANDTDTALIVLDPGLHVDSWILETTSVTDVATVADLTIGRNGQMPMICFYGATTGGGPQCGTNSTVEGDKLALWAPAARPGDSGGPVWAVWPDGSRSAVGSLIRTGSTPGKPDTVAATLAAPWLDKWSLTLK
ncbi:S1 family peptidase [Mycobacteroides abscessus]|uniref:S1 family peptidase n=1 Tax=Mycobacteroides abscessus TaxID=36809 RepID=UPI001F2958BD|nr:S1 family peptidase [Mycobacteroides abscessus]MDB2207063.1 S1 family peptidase [Mycobacteroides abscessus subsp. massiliense]MDB2211084.1 S1 family peptidase [Mycobacteroides abscessus subsp. massiliense]MDB2229137.1 S1 family peptidase [Mycobacteroides abscessus subsp. abscessus]MDB2234818.1 S1 family peptidase [Mycobacteroides abscessus subsp. massiliense]MDM2162379.1 S1 family peptidase [Mycobacteroides abscessus]